MKHLNKTIFTATLLTSFFLGQPVLAGDQAEHDQYSGHAAASLESKTTAPKMKHEHETQAGLYDNTGLRKTTTRVNYMKHEHEDAFSEQLFPSGRR
jgi:hypothetical protein